MSESNLQALAIEAGRLASQLPLPVVESLARSIGACDLTDWSSSRSRILQGIPQPNFRNLVLSFLDLWRNQFDRVRADAVSLAILTAAHSTATHRGHQTVELVWTGPDVDQLPLRRTEQALLQVIDSATQQLLVVSYAVYNIPNIASALVRAAKSGTKINIVIETPDRLEGQNTYDTLKALGSGVAEHCTVYLWPKEHRQCDTNGRPGILHVKCAVADGNLLFLSSANLTEYAFTLNMELGLLITGGDIPKQVQHHFRRMIEAGTLIPV